MTAKIPMQITSGGEPEISADTSLSTEEEETTVNNVSEPQHTPSMVPMVSASSAVLTPANSTSTLTKFRLLLWKNYVLQKRHKFKTFLEIVLPLFFVSILVIIRSIIDSTRFPNGMEFEVWSPTNLSDTVIQQNVQAQLLPEQKPELLEVYYAPDQPNIEKIMTILQENFLTISVTVLGFPNTETLKTKPFASEKELLTLYKARTSQGGVLGAIIFQDGNFGDQITYKLRFPAKHKPVSVPKPFTPPAKWYTHLIYPLFQLLGPREYADIYGGNPGYHSQGFTYLQYALDAALIQYSTGPLANVTVGVNESSINDFFITMRRFPYPAFIDDLYLVALQKQLPLIIMLSFLYPVMNITKSIVVEKEKKLKESMKMMGLPNYLHWSAWFLKHFLFLLISLFLIVICLKIVWFTGLAIIPSTSALIMIVFFLAYVFSSIMLAFLISTWFSKANSASTGAGVIWFLSYFPYFFLSPRYDMLSLTTKLVACLSSNNAMAMGLQIMLMFEGAGVGTQWSNINNGPSPQDPFTVLQCLGMLLLDGLIYFLLTIYIEGVWPGEFGIPLPWYFPVTKTYWCGSHRNITGDRRRSDPNDNDPANPNINFETPPADGKAGISIQGLCKTFGKKKAVRNLSLDMFENQITVLLGHNGAGKTTTMSMLTGLFPPTSGTALINNYDIRKNIKEVRDSLGLCPQHDVLFDELTCEEHLRFFCWMKGCRDVPAEINYMLTALNLEPKRYVQASALSGGMKRKLSVGIALSGGSRIVLLDEPTSGMDPGARRSTWDLLTSEKKGRTILLSTHFMDEADLLGDRIAIMAHGQLQTVGSSLFLKKRFGGGYHLVIVKKAGCDVGQITGVLMRHLEDLEVEVEQDIGAELSYSLPDRKSHLFADMFEELESRREELMIDSYGASITTMEEVFMRVGKEAEAKEGTANSDGDDASLNMSTLQSSSKYHLYERNSYNSGFALNFQQFWAMIVKKSIYSRRNWILFVVQTIIPVMFLIIALILIKTLPKSTDNPLLKLDLEKFKSPVTTLACEQANHPVCNSYEMFAKEAKSRVQKAKLRLSNLILAESRKDQINVNYHYLVGMEKIENNLTAYYNNQPFHVQPVALNFMMNALFRQLASNDKKRINVINHPLPFTTLDDISNAEGIASTGFQIGFNLVFGGSFLAAAYVVFLIRERESNAKHLQYVSGARFWIFWLSNFVFDFTIYVIVSVLLIIVLVAFQAHSFTRPVILVIAFLLLLFHAWATIPVMYLFSFRFSIPSSGFTRMVMINIFSGIAPLLAVSIMQIPELELESTAEILDWIFLIFPNYNLAYSFVKLSFNEILHETCPKINTFPNVSQSVQVQACALPQLKDTACCVKYPRSFLGFDSPGIGTNLASLFGIGLLCFIILFIMEGKLIQKIRCRKNNKRNLVQDSNANGSNFGNPTGTEDSDVSAEASRIRGANLKELVQSENLVMKNLSKSYGSFTAVQCLNLGVKKSECFGLLGVNGAGKTTTFKMLTGDLHSTSGDAFVCGKSINSDIKNVQKNIGYCPQFDAIIDELTGRETIRLFARLRGIRENEITKLTNTLGEVLLFSEHMDKPVKSYSGGNKRKLSTALALVGNPPVVFLDEPTTGMDPVARRHLWNCVTKVRDAGTSIVLTSHSMEECEALCTRLVVMVNGEFCCLGSIQHLKSKFGEGYTVVAQMRTQVKTNRTSLQEMQMRSTAGSAGISRTPKALAWEVELQPLRKFIEESFPGSILKDVHPGYVHYHVTSPNLRWADLFRKMVQANEMFKLEAYSVGQTSLEQVFLNFAKGQINDE